MFVKEATSAEPNTTPINDCLLSDGRSELPAGPLRQQQTTADPIVLTPMAIAVLSCCTPPGRRGAVPTIISGLDHHHLPGIWLLWPPTN